MRKLSSLNGVSGIEGSNLLMLISEFDDSLVLIKENALVLRKYTLLSNGQVLYSPMVKKKDTY